MVNFNHAYHSNGKNSRIDYVFYFVSVVLAAVIFAYLLLLFKMNLQNKSIADVEKSKAALATAENQLYEKKVLDYKKKIDDFANIISSHKISSGIFNFIEEKTVKNIWFSQFNMSGASNEIKLSGEAQTLDALSQQINIFEANQEYIKDANIISSETGASGKISFIIGLSLNPEIFSYQPVAPVPSVSLNNP